MANTREAFERLLTSIPRFPSGENFKASQIMDYYTAMEAQYLSEMFMSSLLNKRLERAATTQVVYDRLFLKIKEISKQVDQIYNLKYGNNY